MNVPTGIVCGVCDRLNPYDQPTCQECGNNLSLLGVNRAGEERSKKPQKGSPPAESDREVKPRRAAKQEAEDKPMEQARHKICPSCFSPVPTGHKFCGKCGAPGDGEAVSVEPDYYGDMQVPGKAKLILIKGEGMDGISYHLNSTEHVAGRAQGAILFTDDKWLSPKHANFYYADDKLIVRDEGSVNGVYLCVRGPAEVQSGAMFMAGGQVFRVDKVGPISDEPEPDGTYFFASPRKDAGFRVVQVLEGSGEGIVVHAKDNQVVIGREGCDINFPNDPYMSGTHLKVELQGDVLRLVDVGSKNGTYLKVGGEAELSHGDYLFLGRQLLRVEITN